MGENIKKPQIRFVGFTDAWEQRKLGDVVDVQSGRDYKHLSEGDIPVYGTGGYMLSVSEALSYNHDAIGIGRKGTIDKPYVLKAPFWTVDTLFYALPREKNNLSFLNCIFQNVDWKKKDESTGVPSLSKTTINDVDITVPNETEQKAIGLYFDNLDHLITLHQRKYDKLVNIKKSMLEKMFPKNGSNVPEIRFAGFTDAWEQRKLEALAEIKTGYPFDSDQFDESGEYLVITNGNIQNESEKVNSFVGNHIDITDDKILDAYLLNINDILVTMDGTVGRTAKVADKKLILAQRVGRLIPNINAEFLYQWLNTGSFFNNMKDLSHGGTIKHISLKDIGSYTAYLPKDNEEQIKIGDYFKNLDHLITLHQRKLELLKNIKKAMLEKMFV